MTPRTCWCGEPLLEHSRAGRPSKYCSTAHRPSSYQRKYPQRPYVPREASPEQLERERVLREYRTQRDELTTQFGTVCGVCGESESLNRELCINLWPATNQVRGMICNGCNQMLGHAGEDLVLLTAAAAYLRRHRELHATTSNPYERFQTRPRNVPSRVLARTGDVLAWRNDGMTFKEMGRRLGVTRQRATQLWEAAQSAVVVTCWCGEPIPLTTRAGTPDTFCRPEHVAHGSGLLALSQFKEMVDAQDGKCAICLDVPSLLNVDHDHETGRVRELLCSRCNKMLGAGKDDAHVFDLGITYLGK